MLRKYLIFRDPGAPVSTSGPAADQTGGEQETGKAPTAGNAPPLLKGQATAEEIEAWKTQYKDIYLIEVGGQVGYFIEPSRNHINCALATGDPESPLGACEELAILTFIKGQSNTGFLKDDTIYPTVMGAMKMKLDGIPGRIAKL